MKQAYLKNVSTLEITEDACTGCGTCLLVCPHDVLELSAKKAHIRRPDSCMECGACMRNCPFGAISVSAGVGCAYGIIRGALTGGEADCCGSGSCC
ncbi:MAG: mercury methylation ferredoxin HgcB [Syntrophorhabdus sp.]